MVNDTRSARKSKDEGKDQASGVRRSARETALSRQMTPSPQSMRKSKRLEKGTPPLTPTLKRKSERLGKYNTPSPLRRSDRGKKFFSSSSSGPKKSGKELTLSELKRKKKNLIQVTMESEKAELDLEAVGMKRKKLNSRSFKALFKRQRIKEIVPDGDGELEGRDKLSDVCSDNSKGIGSETMGNGVDISDECSRRMVGKLRDESIDKASDGALQKSICSLNQCHVDTENDVNMDSSHRDNVLDEPCSKYSHPRSSVRGKLDYPEGLPTNCSSTENMDVPESESSTCLAKARDGSVCSDISEKCMRSREATPSPSPRCENCNILGTCVLCSKNKRVGYNSPEQELCSCNPSVNEDLGSFSTCKDRSDHEAAVTSETAEKCDCRHILTETHADSEMDGHESVCALCKKDGELLCCVGKGCKRCYHLCCLDPPLTDALPGVWHCPLCVKKKLLFGVHSVSKGVESIWDVREVEVSNVKGVRQRQYLVKYHGLAHIHNHWVPEKQLLLENPCLASDFIEKDQVVRWSTEWTVPHRLLRKKSIQDNIYIASSSVISVCNYEWLVKWHGLSYDHATWELDNADFLSSSLGQNLMKDYEIRCQKAKHEVNQHHKGSTVKLSELPASQSLVNDNYVLKNVNKLRECLFKCQNAVVFDDQERAMTIIFFLRSMREICRPFLIVTASSSLSQWEAEFARLVPSLDVVVYSGNSDTRKGIRASEFYDEGGRLMLQVLLSSAEAVLEDRDRLRSIKWEAIVIDEYQHFGISNDLEQIKMLTTDCRILLASGQIKDTTAEYLKMLSLLESHGDLDKLGGLKSETNDNLCRLKDRLSHFIAYGSNSQVSKFLEYWVPVQISNYQLEQYCATLLSNSITLCSCSRNDRVGAFRDILLTVRKCCDHPYLLDSSVQERLIAEQRAAELLDIGIKASGKLELLDMMLTEINTRGLQVLVLFQLISGSGGVSSTGDILDDFLRQRFGKDSYERVDGGVSMPSKKQAVVNRFNKKETGQFVFLLDNRACSSTIKLSSLDVVVIYDSDWNPANDLRALQKISFGSKVEQIKVFRLYSSFTVEERALVLAKQNLNLDNNLQTFSRATTDTLLSWGAVYLFSKLDEYHADGNSTSDSFNFSPGQLLLSEVTKELQAILSENCENTDSNSVIAKVKLGVRSYSTNIPTLGEAKVQLKDGEVPNVFWRNLLDGKNYIWKHLRGPSPRNRKRINYFDGSPRKSPTKRDDVVKKRKKTVNDNLDPPLLQVELGADQVAQVAVAEGGPSTIKACNQSQNLQRDGNTSNNNPNGMSGHSSFGTEVPEGLSEERIVLSDEQKTLHSFLQGEMMRLCQSLKLSEDVAHLVRRFLEYVIKNHHVNSNSPSILQAFQISLCWIAASVKKQKIDKKDSLMLAKQLLNYQCTEVQAHSVYSILKSMYLQFSEKTVSLGRDCLLADDGISKEPSNADVEVGGKSANEEHAEGQILLQEKLALKDKATASDIDNKIKKIQKKCDKRMKKLNQKHQEELQEFNRIWDEKRLKLETDHKLESAFIRSIHGQGSVRIKILENKFAEKMKEHNLLKDVDLKKLETVQLDAIDEERDKAAQWLAKAKACSSGVKAVNGPQSLGSQPEEDVVGGPQPSTRTNIMGSGAGDVIPVSGQHLEDQNPSKSCTRGDDVAPSIASISTPAEAIGCETSFENLVTVNVQNEVGVSSGAMFGHVNQSKHSSDNEETVLANLPAPLEQVSDEIRLDDLIKEIQVEVPGNVSDEVMGHVDSVEERSASEKESAKGSKITSPDALVSQRCRPDEAASGDLQDPRQPLVHSEQTVALPQQVQQDKVDQSLVSAELQDLDEQAVENQSSLQIEVELVDTVATVPSNLEATVQQDKNDQSLVSAELQDLDAPAVENQSTLQTEVELVDTVAPVPSNLEATVIDETVTPVLSNHEPPVTENSEQLHSGSLDESLSRNQSPAIEDHDEGRSSSQSAEPGGAEVPSHESISQSGEILEIHHNHLNTGPVSNVALGQSAEFSALSQNDVATPQAVVSTAERPHQAVLQLGIDAGHLEGPSYLLHPTRQPTSWSSPPLLADPLQNELERIRREREQLEKTHKDMMSQLRTDCEKEIQEIIAQIRKRYEVKLQETEAEFRLKRNELDQNQNKVAMNKILAEVFRSKCKDPTPSGTPCVQQAVPSSFVQHMHQLSMPPPSTRPPPVASACQPAPTQQQITPPAVQTIHQLPRPHSVRPPTITIQNVTAPPTIQNVTAPPVQAVQHAAALFSGTSSRPPLISAITPVRNSRVGGEIRSAAPHLQSFRPAVASSPAVSQLRPLQRLPSQPIQTPPPPGPPPVALTNLVVPAPPNPSLSTVGSVPENRISTALPEICSTFCSLELADLEILGNVEGNQTSTVASDVVCLSDDE